MKKLLFLAALAITFVGCKAQNPITQVQPFIFTKWVSIGNYTTTQMPTPGSCLRCILYNSDSANYTFSNGSSWVYFNRGGAGSTVWGTIGGSLNAQTDLMNRLNLKVNYSDTAITLAPYLLKVNGVKYGDTASMLAPYLKAMLGVKYSDTSAMLLPYLQTVNFTKTNIGLSSVLNAQQVVNKGGADSMQVGTFAGIPSASVGPTFYYATDSNAWYYNNRSAYTKIAGGGGGGGGTADSNTFLTRYRASITYVPLSIYTLHGIDSILGYTPYDASNPNGYISGNQTISFAAVGGDVVGTATGSTSLSVVLTLPSHTITYVKMQQGAAKSIVGNSLGTVGDFRPIIPKFGIVWDADSLKSDTSVLLPLHRLGDSTLVLRSLIGGKSNPDSTLWQTKYRSDTSRTNIYAALLGKQASGNYALADSTLWQTKYRTDTMRTNIYAALLGKANADSTVWQTKYRSDTSRTNIYAALLGKQASGNYAIADSTLWQTKYRSDTSRANLYAAILGKQASGNYAIADSTLWQTKYRSDTSRTNIYAALLGKQASGNYALADSTLWQTKYRTDTMRTNIYAAIAAGGGGGADSTTLTGFALTRSNTGSIITIKFDSTGGNGFGSGSLPIHTMGFNDVRYRKGLIDSVELGLIYDSTLIAYRGSSGDSILKGSHDTLFVPLIRDSLAMHHVKNADGSWTFYTVGGAADSTIFYTKYRSDTSRTNIYAALLGKQAAGSYITALTGDVAASGPGSVTATVNGLLGHTLPSVTTGYLNWTGTAWALTPGGGGGGGAYYPPLDSVLLKGAISARAMAVGAFKSTGNDTLTATTYSAAFNRVLTQDTVSGRIYRQSVQTLDTTGAASGKTAPIWNGSTKFIMSGPFLSADSTVTVTTGTSSTVPNACNVFVFAPTSAISTYTLTLPTTWHVDKDLLIVFPVTGSISQGSNVVTSLTVVNGSGQTLSQSTTPITGTAGEIIRYHLVNGTIDQRTN